MRIVLGTALILFVWMGGSSAKAGFQWLEPWPAGSRGTFSAYASYPDDQGDHECPNEYHGYYFEPGSVCEFGGATRRFKITNAPTGLPITLSASWFAIVDWMPQRHGIAFASVWIEGVDESQMQFGFAGSAYSPDQPEYEGGEVNLLLEDGVYTLSVSVFAGMSVSFTPFPPSLSLSSFSQISVRLTAVPEPTSLVLLLLAFILAGLASLRLRMGARLRRGGVQPTTIV